MLYGSQLKDLSIINIPEDKRPKSEENQPPKGYQGPRNNREGSHESSYKFPLRDINQNQVISRNDRKFGVLVVLMMFIF